MRVGQHVPGPPRTLPPLTCTRKLCVQGMNRPDISNPSGQTLLDSCGTLANRNSSQPCRMTGSHWAVTVGVWMSGLVCETQQWKTQEVGQARRCWEKVVLGSKRSPHERKQNPFFPLRGLRLEVNFWSNIMLLLFIFLSRFFFSFFATSVSHPFTGNGVFHWDFTQFGVNVNF